ncbi:RNA polymerase sigma factor [Planctomycetes bacterium Poly30]|uniref:RNA polymerase sigma factor n=1 Tax=Saltatorellus ferox TaxID=2528018 RepID=A0A518ENH6_9BACT|nr:RNA polymerase sigma factor [Planctomycetes bacterium Poly30]
MSKNPPQMVTEADFERWIDAFRGPLVGLLASWGSDWAAAEELAVDAFAEAWVGRERFRGDPQDLGAAGAWLKGIAFRLRGAQQRRLRRLPTLSAERPEPAAPEEEPDERREHLALGFARLKPEHQTVLRMYYLEETSAAEVAALLGLTPKAVEARLYQARKALRVKVHQVRKEEVTA